MWFIGIIFACSIPLLLWGYFFSFLWEWFQRKIFALWILIGSMVAFLLVQNTSLWAYIDTLIIWQSGLGESQNYGLLSLLSIIWLSLVPIIYLAIKKHTIYRKSMFLLAWAGVAWIILLFFFLLSQNLITWDKFVLISTIILYWLYAFLEEYLKGLGVLSNTNKTKNSYIFLSICIALGFAFFENIIYVTQSSSQTLTVYLFRSIFSTSIHIFSSAILWHFIYSSLNKSMTIRILWILFLWLLLSSMLHASFNIFLEYWFIILSPIYFIAWYFYLSYLFYSNPTPWKNSI